MSEALTSLVRQVAGAVPRMKFYFSDLPEELRAVLAATSVAPQAG